MNELQELREAAKIGLWVASNQEIDYITILYGRGAKSTMRLWPYLSLEPGEKPENYLWPVKGQHVVIETVCESVTFEQVQDLVEVLCLHGVSMVMVLFRYHDIGWVIDRTSGELLTKERRKDKLLLRLWKKRIERWNELTDQEEKKHYLDLFHHDADKLITLEEEA